MLFRAIMVAFFILATSFFVAAEFALVSVRETRIEQLIALGRPGARTALKLKHSIDEFLPAVQFGVTLASLALGGIGEPAIAEIILRLTASWYSVLPLHAHLYAHTVAVILSFALITYLEVLLGELVPKSLALQRAERIALAVAGPMDVFIRITRPAVRLMNSSATVVLQLFRAPLSGEGAVHSPEELKLIATATRRMGLLPPFQEEIIHRAIELNHVTVREIMTPRGKIFSLPADLAIEQASARIVEEQHSRVPVFNPAGGPEQIIGVVYSKDVSRLMHFRAVALGFHVGPSLGPSLGPALGPALGPSLGPDRQTGGNRASGLTLRQVMREVAVVPETKLAVELLQEFQERRRQIAVVVDEFGSTVGIVTAEDALEQIVGELEDEFDIASRTSNLSTAGVLSLDGSTTLRDLSTQLRWTFPREAGVETLAGFLLLHFGHIPVAGETLDFDGRRYTVAEMTGRRIARVNIEALHPETTDLEAEAEDGTSKESTA